MAHHQTAPQKVSIIAMRLKDYARATMSNDPLFSAEDRIVEASAHDGDWLVFTAAKDRYVSADARLNINEDHQFQLLSALGAPCTDAPNHSAINDARYYKHCKTGWTPEREPHTEIASILHADNEAALRALLSNADITVVTTVPALDDALVKLHRNRVMDGYPINAPDKGRGA